LELLDKEISQAKASKVTSADHCEDYASADFSCWHIREIYLTGKFSYFFYKSHGSS